uniref:Uncharacterized protein n=1 Tax=Trichobilharzia regenti TaxID=157069 RepID=A0AA85KHS1_TRIRE|nr:unnamed protein product [Trichobilharzia regenti]
MNTHLQHVHQRVQMVELDRSWNLSDFGINGLELIIAVRIQLNMQRSTFDSATGEFFIFFDNCEPFHSICRIRHAGADHYRRINQLDLRCSFQHVFVIS